MKILILQKMKTSIYKSGLLLASALVLFSAAALAQEVSKEYHKEYTTTADASLNISNKYGDVVIHSWDKDQVVIDIKVTIELPNRERAEKLLSYIDVRFEEEGAAISASTIIDEKFNFSGWGGQSRRFSIDYTVSMPVKMDLAVSNRYGDTDLEQLSGLVRLDIKYGNLTASSLGRGNVKPLSYLNIAYGKADINSVGWLDITSRYSGSLSINNSQALLLDSKYSTIKLGETSSIVGESKYDNIRIDRINNLVLDGGYADIVIGTLEKKLRFEGGYGSFTVDQIPAGFESLEINSKYIGVNLGIEDNASYDLDAKLSYGDLKFDDENFRYKRQIIENTSKEVSGSVGKEPSPGSKVIINSSYGSVKLY